MKRSVWMLSGGNTIYVDKDSVVVVRDHSIVLVGGMTLPVDEDADTIIERMGFVSKEHQERIEARMDAITKEPDGSLVWAATGESIWAYEEHQA